MNFDPAMDAQIVVTVISLAINLIMMVGGAIVTWFLKGLQGTLGMLQVENEKLRADIISLQVLVMGKHVTREELDTRLEKMNDAIFRKLDRIEDKLNSRDAQFEAGARGHPHT